MAADSVQPLPPEHRAPTRTTAKVLYGTAVRCGMPTCSEPLYRQSSESGEWLLNSRIAHIHARRRGGPRWDGAMSEDDNSSPDNLILLCEKHASEIDATPREYPADLLREWKRAQLAEAAAQPAGHQPTDSQMRDVMQVSFGLEEFADIIAEKVPFSARLRSRDDALSLASRAGWARRLVRLGTVPGDRRQDILDWMDTDDSEPVVDVAPGQVRVLVAPMGAGKSEKAERWWSKGLAQGFADPQIEIPVWIEARNITASLEAAIHEAIGHDPVRPLRIVVDNLDAVSAGRANQILLDARRLVLVWPQTSVLVTTRPGAGDVRDHERLLVAPWPEDRGVRLLRLLVGEKYYEVFRTTEARRLLTSPLLVHAFASRLQAGGDARASSLELLSGLARTVIEREHPHHATPELWDMLGRLAARVLDTPAPVEAHAFGREPDIWALTETGLVVNEEGRLRFALPVFEQYFAGQALDRSIVRIEDAAAPQSFPRWRYAIAFTLATSSRQDAEEHMERLARANPAAASWTLDEITSPASGLALGAAVDAAQVTIASLHPGWESHPDGAALTVGTWLRDSILAWLDGLESLGPQLAPHHEGALAAWGVAVGGGWVTVAEARQGSTHSGLVPLGDQPPDISGAAGWARWQQTIVPPGPLDRWRWSRERLRQNLETVIRRGTLPVPPRCALAHERLWFLARRIMQETGLAPAAIPLAPLRARVDEMMHQVDTTRWSRWEWTDYTADSDDIRWMHTQLAQQCGELLANPRPLPDRASPTHRYIWQDYSPELTRTITTQVLRDAITGYRDLVETNFPRFGSALGLYSALPVRAEGAVVVPPLDDTEAFTAGLLYTLLPAEVTDPGAEPVVDLGLSTGEVTLSGKPVPTTGSVFHSPALSHTSITPLMDRQASELAYGWLARDLHRIGWLTPHVQLIR